MYFYVLIVLLFNAKLNHSKYVIIKNYTKNQLKL